MAMAFDLLKRNGSLEDHATMLRLAAGKRWEFSRHNKIVCKACQGDFRGLRHPLLKCNNLHMIKSRKLWIDNCRAYIEVAKPDHLRHRMLDILYEAVHSEGGEFACLGTFSPKWVAKLRGDTTMSLTDLRAIKRFLRVIASGGRLVMREYARIKEVSEGEARELRQLSIAQFAVSCPKAQKVRKPTSGKADLNNAPVHSIWGASDRSSECRLEWRGRIQSSLLTDPIPAAAETARSGGQLLLPGALPPLIGPKAPRSRKSNKGAPPLLPLDRAQLVQHTHSTHPWGQTHVPTCPSQGAQNSNNVPPVNELAFTLVLSAAVRFFPLALIFGLFIY